MKQRKYQHQVLIVLSMFALLVVANYFGIWQEWLRDNSMERQYALLRLWSLPIAALLFAVCWLAMFKFTVADIDPYHFQLFSIGAISIIAIFSSMIISTIEKGDIRGGVKFIPLFLAGALIMYFIFTVILGAALGGVII